MRSNTCCVAEEWDTERRYVVSTSGSRTSDTGGPHFIWNFWTTFFRRFPKNVCIFPQKCSSISQNFWWPFFLLLVIIRRGRKSVADIDRGAKILTFRQIHSAIITLSALEGGQTPLPTSMRGPWPDLPPWIRHCPAVQYCNATIFLFLYNICQKHFKGAYRWTGL